MLLRRLLRELLDSWFGAPFRALLDFREYRRSRRVVIEASEKYGWTPLQLDVVSAIRHKKDSDTLYILGSGSSVNQLSDDIWAEIAKHVSVGINHWTLHQFVPDIYAVETIPDHRIPNGGSQRPGDLNHLNHLRALNRPEVTGSDAIIIALAPRTARENMQLLEMPELMKSRTFSYYRFTPFTRKTRNISSDYSHSFKFSRAASSEVVVPDSGASLIRLIVLALQAGFNRVVLTGVDLSTLYFWEQSEAKLAQLQHSLFPQPMLGASHETLSANSRPFSVDVVLRELSVLCSKNGVEIQNRSAPSPLSEFLPQI